MEEGLPAGAESVVVAWSMRGEVGRWASLTGASDPGQERSDEVVAENEQGTMAQAASSGTW
jgi:hypothetical protein